MAPRNQPLSLYELCVQATASVIDYSCTHIQLEHGNYDCEESVAAVRRLQKHLVDNLAVSVFEMLCERRNSRMRMSQLIWNRDTRIKLGLFLHPCLTRFSVDAKGNELMQNNDDGLDEFFWCGHIRQLHNLTHINLNLITTDELLLIIGRSCPKLEVVNIVSRIKQTYSDFPDISIPPGITLKFCVSDLGLAALEKCKNIRHITMNKVINYGTPYRGITYAGIRSLVRNLPKLQFINSESLGKILDESFTEPLHLTYFSEMDPKFMKLDRMEQLCPNITHISLSVPLIINYSGSFDANVAPCNGVLAAIASSSYRLRVLELQHFPFGDGLKRLLQEKGAHLEELLLRTIGPMTSEHIVYIADHCYGIRKLHLKELGGEEPSGVAYVDYRKKNYFPRLESLYVSGRMWDLNLNLPLILSSAFNVKKISLLNMGNERILDGAFQKVLQRNALPNATSIYLYTGCYVSLPMIRQMAFDCPKLRCLSFLQHESVFLAEVEALRTEMAKANLDIKLCCLELFDFHDTL